MGVFGQIGGVFSSGRGRLRVDMSCADQDALSEIDNVLQIQHVLQAHMINEECARAELLWKEMIGLQKTRVLG